MAMIETSRWQEMELEAIAAFSGAKSKRHNDEVGSPSCGDVGRRRFAGLRLTTSPHVILSDFSISGQLRLLVTS